MRSSCTAWSASGFPRWPGISPRRADDMHPTGSAGLTALAPWLGQRLSDAAGHPVSSVDIVAPARAGGQSSEIWLFEARWTERGRHRSADLVLRRQPGYDGIFLRPDAGREFEVLRGLAAHPAVPVPRVRWVERDPAVLGAPFFIMDRVPGVVPSGRPSVHSVGWLTTLTPGQRRTAWQSAIDALAALHDVPWQRSHAFLAAGDETPGLAAYLRDLAEWYHWAARGRRFPITDAALAHILAAAAAPDPRARNPRGPAASAPTVCWGDPRPGNIIFDPGRCVPAALVDWENAAIAPPEADVAHWLVFDEFATSALGVERLPGYASRDEILSRYEAVSGRRLGDIEYFEIVRSFFLATTLIRQADAGVRSGKFAEGTRMGHANLLTQMLARRLGLPVPELSEDYLRHRSAVTSRAEAVR
jgi:aminoglycoside phosphotransferase (APT) family kinase protein